MDQLEFQTVDELQAELTEKFGLILLQLTLIIIRELENMADGNRF